MQRLLTVYPRWRGEHNFLHDWITVRTGLSPLARGTQIKTNILLVRRRFIPAGAGNTFGSSPSRPVFSVYPRWRGEHDIRENGLDAVHGLSPLARGTRGRRGWPGPPDTVYPRWRGEHAASAPRTKEIAGLSPLARGTQLTPGNSAASDRFIPAGAGNTDVCDTIIFRGAVYPRWRGEHCSSVSMRG